MRIFEHPAQLLIVVLLLVLLFGAKRLPDAARGIGRSLRIFKSEMQELQKDDEKPAAGSQGTDSEPAPLEGRVVDENRTQGTEQRRDA